MGDKGKVVLAYSGGLDTSVATMWLTEQGYDVITMTADVGQKEVDLEASKNKALHSGAIKAYVMDLRKQFVDQFVWPALKSNGMYQGTYPLNSALSRPLIAQTLATIAKKEGAIAVAHGFDGAVVYANYPQEGARPPVVRPLFHGHTLVGQHRCGAAGAAGAVGCHHPAQLQHGNAHTLAVDGVTTFLEQGHRRVSLAHQRTIAAQGLRGLGGQHRAQGQCSRQQLQGLSASA